MKIGGIEYLVSFLLLLLGFVFGSLTPKEEFFTVGVSDIFQILAAVGTVVAAVIAIPGLNSWRKQFKHGEKIKRLEGLRKIDAALSALYSHCESCNRYVASKDAPINLSCSRGKLQFSRHLQRHWTKSDRKIMYGELFRPVLRVKREPHPYP